MGVENGMFWSEIGPGFGNQGGTPSPRDVPPPPLPPRRRWLYSRCQSSYLAHFTDTFFLKFPDANVLTEAKQQSSFYVNKI